MQNSFSGFFWIEHVPWPDYISSNDLIWVWWFLQDIVSFLDSNLNDRDNFSKYNFAKTSFRCHKSTWYPISILTAYKFHRINSASILMSLLDVRDIVWIIETEPLFSFDSFLATLLGCHLHICLYISTYCKIRQITSSIFLAIFLSNNLYVDCRLYNRYILPVQYMT